MVPQLKENFLHLESGGDRLDKDGRADGVVSHADVGLREVEDVVPETSLLVVFHLGKIEVRTESASYELLGVVEEVERKVKQGAGHGSVVDGHSGLVQMPSARTVRINEPTVAHSCPNSLRTAR